MIREAQRLGDGWFVAGSTVSLLSSALPSPRLDHKLDHHHRHPRLSSLPKAASLAHEPLLDLYISCYPARSITSFPLSLSPSSLSSSDPNLMASLFRTALIKGRPNTGAYSPLARPTNAFARMRYDPQAVQASKRFAGHEHPLNTPSGMLDGYRVSLIGPEVFQSSSNMVA